MIPVTLAKHLHAKLTGIMERRGGHAGRDAGRGESVGLRGHRGGGGLIQPSLPAAESPAEAGVAAHVARGRRPLVVAAWATVAVPRALRFLPRAPVHVGTCVPVLLAWLIVDRARPRWYGPVAVGLLLAWALVADQVVLLIGVLPLVAVCVVRVYQAVVRQRQPLRSRWYEVSLAAAAVAAAGVAAVAVALITARGGFVVWPVARVFTSVSAMPHHLLLIVEGVLLLFRAAFCR